ncbi:DinB family protein [Dictyobacter aurantiacus]|uniref:DinB-like domain-containing protein n=1 Tax=Dictyobacter aurantiacus TaxID=1936993 RepID=A0A401ZIA7_9CHLR|nr:DinB family protein [Dictyobacter aurantiacus]GCE06573.1 hypothetical protein KDAU_39020 [Dictyobacter aurantiacus]
MTVTSSLELMTPWRLLRSLRKTPRILQTLLRDVTSSQAQQAPHDAHEWSIIEVLCHLRDYEDIFFRRALLILTEEYPLIPIPESNEELARKGKYKQQDITTVLDSLFTTRQAFLQALNDLHEDQWMRKGIHGEQFPITLKEAVLQVIMHDIDHIEQITQLLHDGRSHA